MPPVSKTCLHYFNLEKKKEKHAKDSNPGLNLASGIIEPLRQPTDEIPMNFIVYNPNNNYQKPKQESEKSHSDIMVLEDTCLDTAM